LRSSNPVRQISRSRAVRLAATVLLPALLLLAVLPGAAPAAAPVAVATAQAVSYGSEELAFVHLLNDYRQSQGLPALLVSDLLSDAASKHGLDMGKYGFFGHTNTTGSDFFAIPAGPGARMAACGYNINYGWGENIAAGYSTAASVFQAWVESSTHDTNMRGSSWTVIGVSLDYVSGSEYGWYWTTDFGVYVDATAHSVDGAAPSTTTTARPTTTTEAPATSTTSTTKLPTTTTTPPVPPPTTTTTTLPVPPPTPSFSDVKPGSPYYAEITNLAATGVVSGYDDGRYHPTDPVTRAQFAKIIVLALGVHAWAAGDFVDPTFSDVPYTGFDYPFVFIEQAAALGIVEGYENGAFRPGSTLIRTQLALMLVRAGDLGLATPPASYVCPFTDVPAYAWEAVRVAHYNNLLSGKTATEFDPYGPATRGHVAKMVYSLTQVLAP
jgi:uncharacterized protein YkwD